MSPFTRRGHTQTSTSEWAALLRYKHVASTTATRVRHRGAQRRSLAFVRLHPPTPASVDSIDDDSVWTTHDPPPPSVGPDMTARDLFALEMWHLPVICARDYGDHETAYDIWDNRLSPGIKHVWEHCVQLYISERQLTSPLSFAAAPPWWMKAPV